MKKKTAAFALLSTLIFLFAGCGSMGGVPWYDPFSVVDEFGAESSREIVERDFVTAEQTPEATFSLDANTAAYSIMRSRLNAGRGVDEDTVRIEEYINYFRYESYEAPEAGESVRLNASLFDCPWNASHKLLRVGLRTEDLSFAQTRNNLVFLIDVSGSMYGEDRLGLVRESFRLLLENLGEDDRVSIVTYASGVKTRLSGARGSEKTRIAAVIDELEAGGSTSGESGIRTAYDVARQYFVSGGNNRVILATDGDFNVGMSSPEELESLIRREAQSGVFLSVLGFGMGNTKDDVMETLALAGNGNYAYIDGLTEARRALVESLNGTLKTVAKDAKALVRFDPARVARYRLIGYENKMITIEEWEDDQKDTGEIGAGLTVTALFEIEPTGTETDAAAGTFFMRYKDADGTSDQVLQKELSIAWEESESADDRFIACVAEFGLLLRESKYRGDASFESVIQRLEDLDADYLGSDEFKSEFLTLVRKANQIYG